MDITLQPNGAFHSALVHLAPGDLFKSDSGAMFRASSNVDNDVTTISRGGGLLAGLKRLAGGDTFFLSTFQTTDGGAGEVGVAPILQGHLERVDVQAEQSWLCAGGSFLGCDGHILMALFTQESRSDEETHVMMKSCDFFGFWRSITSSCR